MDEHKHNSLLAFGMVGAMLLTGCSSMSIVSRAEEKSFEPAPVYHFQDDESPNQGVMYQDQIWEGQSSFHLPSDAHNISESAISLHSPDGSDRPVSEYPSLGSEYSSVMRDAGQLTDVYFEYDRFSLRREAMEALERNAQLLKSGKEWVLMVEGHTDERGTSDYNLVLGERRARVVQQYLKDLGVPTSNLRIVSFGKEKPFCKEANEDCRQQNRRVHFVKK